MVSLNQFLQRYCNFSMKMSSFFRLVDDVLIDIFSYWIEAKDLANLDSACCKKIERTHFTQLLSKPQITTNYEKFMICTDGLLKWCIVRKLRLRSLWIKGINFSNLDDISKLNLSSVVMLQTSIGPSAITDNMNQLICMVNRCVHLNEIYIKNEEPDSSEFELVSQLSSTILSRLKVLHWSCWSLGCIRDETILNLAIHCKVLTDFRLNYLSDEAVSALAQLILNNSQSLHRISFSFNSPIIVDPIIIAAQSCQNVIEINVEIIQSDVVSFSEVAKLIRLSKRCQKFWFDSELGLLAIQHQHNELSLTLDGCDIHGQGWTEVLYAIPKIDHLILSDCTGVSVDQLRSFSVSRSYLSSVLIAFCALHISLKELRDIFPQCDTLQINGKKWSRTVKLDV